MEVLELNDFLSFKNKLETQELDSKTLLLLNSLFTNFDRKKKASKNGTNILKNHKIQNKKETITNKVNLILNKLSESNMDLLVGDFIENINMVDLEQYDEIQKAFYVKIISEINFLKIYMHFFKIISVIYNKVLNYDISYFISIVETKFKLDYSDNNSEILPRYSFLSENNDESKRINNLNLLRYMVENKFLVPTLLDNCDTMILNQNKYLTDIYYWFNSKNRILTKDETEKITMIQKGAKNLSREKVLLDSLLNKSIVPQVNVVINEVKVAKPKIVSNNTIVLECDNIIEEYILMKSIDDIKHFIETKCVDAITKNKFCYQLIDKYFLGTKETCNDIIELIKQLIKSQTLFKSNLSRGLLLLNTNWKEVSIDYIKPVDKMKTLLIMLKSIGITKGLELMLENYNIS